MQGMWRPGTKVARRIANAMLRAYRAGALPEGAPPWVETSCIHACTHSRLTPGARAQLGRLWRQYGDPKWAIREEPDVRAELEAQLPLSA